MNGDDFVSWYLTTSISPANLCRGSESSLVVPSDIIHKPRDRDGLDDITRADESEEGEVFRSYRKATLREEDHIADEAEQNAEHDEGVAVFNAVGDVANAEAGDYSDGVDGDGVDLGLDGFVAHLDEDGRDEEVGGVVRVDNSEEHEGAV